MVVIPSRAAESGIAQVFQPVFPLFAPEALESMRQSGMFALSQAGRLEEVLDAAGLKVREDEEVDCRIMFTDVDNAERAFVGAGPTALAIKHSGQAAVVDAMRHALSPFTSGDGRVYLPAWYRIVIATA